MPLTPEEKREKRREYNRRWRETNPEKVREINRRWIEANPEKARKAVRRWHENNPEKRREHKLKREFGITHEQYEQMLADQGGVCAICGADTPGVHVKHFHVDHCHTTGAIRGLLCHSCNTSLGGFKDDPARLRAAADYLEAAHARSAA